MSKEEQDIFASSQFVVNACDSIIPADVAANIQQIGHFKCGSGDQVLNPTLLSERVRDLGFPTVFDGPDRQPEGRLTEIALKAFPEDALILRNAQGLPELGEESELGAHLSCDQKHY
eukprot:65339-Pyramimonas_sp.AAC.1